MPRGEEYALGAEKEWGLRGHPPDFCPYPRSRWNLRRILRIKQNEDDETLGEVPTT